MILAADTSPSEEKESERGIVDTHDAFKFLVAVWPIFCSIDDDGGVT